MFERLFEFEPDHGCATETELGDVFAINLRQRRVKGDGAGLEEAER